MDYALAKELEDAGFPQPGRGSDYDGIMLHTPNCKGWDGPSDCTYETRAYAPTLYELIEACGKKFMSLRKVWNENGEICNWIAEADDGPNPTATIGTTLEEAVARLWLQLNKTI